MRSTNLFLLLAIIGWASQAAHAQTPALAVRYYQSGHEKLKLEDWQGAVEDFTRAIELDARLQAPKRNDKAGVAE